MDENHVVYYLMFNLISGISEKADRNSRLQVFGYVSKVAENIK